MAVKRTNVPPRVKVGKKSALAQGYKAGSGKKPVKLSGTKRIGSKRTSPKYGLEGSGSDMYRRGYSAGKAAAKKAAGMGAEGPKKSMPRKKSR